MQTSEGMYTADVTSGQLRAVEEKLMDRIYKLEAFIEVIVRSMPGTHMSDISRSAAVVFLAEKKNRQEAEEAACKERAFKSMEEAIRRVLQQEEKYW